jgi:hypothetical protein
VSENPINEGGKWINGGAVGLNWRNVQTVPGKAYASGISTGYDDSIAVLNTTFAANQYAQGTVYKAAGYVPPVGAHEIELLLRFQVTAGNARGYEVLWASDGGLVLVRWNGALDSYDPFPPANIGVAVDGDVLRVEMVGTTSADFATRIFKNGVLMHTFTENPGSNIWTTGQPGMGFWPTPGATVQNYGWKSFQAGSL